MESLTPPHSALPSFHHSTPWVYNVSLMQIDREVVLQIAELARIELRENEIDLFTKQLAAILEYMEKLKTVRQPAEPFSPAETFESAVRADVLQPSLPVEEALRNAPDRVKQFFRVPRIIP